MRHAKLTTLKENMHLTKKFRENVNEYFFTRFTGLPAYYLYPPSFRISLNALTLASCSAFSTMSINLSMNFNVESAVPPLSFGNCNLASGYETPTCSEIEIHNLKICS